MLRTSSAITYMYLALSENDGEERQPRPAEGSAIAATRPIPPAADTASTAPPPRVRAHLYILILQRFDVEPDRRDRLDGLVGLVLEPVQDGRLPGIVQAQDQYSHFLGTEEALEEPAH